MSRLERANGSAGISGSLVGSFLGFAIGLGLVITLGRAPRKAIGWSIADGGGPASSC